MSNEKKIGNEIIITETVIKKIKINDLIIEKNLIEQQLNEKEPTEKELSNYGKMYHPFYMPKDYLINRLNEIERLLKIKE